MTKHHIQPSVDTLPGNAKKNFHSLST